MSNPFESAGVNPFGPSSVTGAFSEATAEAKESILAEATRLGNAAIHLDREVNRAKKSGNAPWLRSLQGFAERLGHALVEFVKKAIELAIFKLVLELCAMVMNSVMSALAKKGFGGMELSTPGVYLQKPVESQPAQQRYQSGNPFAGPFGQQASSVSPW